MTTKRLSQILILSCWAFAPLAWSVCEEPVVPELPNPDLAGEVEMLRAQAEVKHYLALQEDYLICVQHNVRRHNKAVELMHEVANKYNSTARRYKTRMKARDMITELALLDLSRF